MSRITDDTRWMERAVALAHKGLGCTAPNPAVGCVIVRGGRVVGSGFHRAAGLAHAEIEALRRAGSRARRATAYITLEPCCHHGRTPPCTDALIAAGIARVVVGCRDPNPRVAGRGLRRLRSAGVRVTEGVLESQCENVIVGFRRWIRTGLPWVTMKLAASLDGRLAARGGKSKWLSSTVARRKVQEMRARSQAILVGVGTVLADDPRLTCRVRRSPQPLRVVLDRRLRTPPDARVVRGHGAPLIVCAPGAPRTRAERLRAVGAEVVAIPGKGRAFWRRLLHMLGERAVHELLIEGGAGVATSALGTDLVNRLAIFYTPKVLGADGLAMFGPLGVRDPEKAPRFTTETVERCGPDVLWIGSPIRKAT